MTESKANMQKHLETLIGLLNEKGMCRRDFLKFTALAMTGLGTSCALSRIRLPFELQQVTGGFRIYNGTNPNIGWRGRETWADNMHEGGVKWSGTGYSKSMSVPIIAPADGLIIRSITIRGYWGMEDDIKINHGGWLISRYFHLEAGRSRKEYGIKGGTTVKRGDIIGHTVANIGSKTRGYYQFNIGDLDDWGHQFGYMQPWEGTPGRASYLDNDILEEVQKAGKRSERMMSLIDELRSKYIGPGHEFFQDTERGIPRVCSHYGKGKYRWTHSTFFKMLKQIYDNNPELYRGTKSENDKLINDIYLNQPAELTLPFKVG